MDAADAYQWTEAVQIQNAYHAAIREVDEEASAINTAKRPET